MTNFKIDYSRLLLCIFLVLLLSMIISSDFVSLRVYNCYYNSVVYENERYGISTLNNVKEDNNTYKEIIIKSSANKKIQVDILSTGFDYNENTMFSCLKTVNVDTNTIYLLTISCDDGVDNYTVDRIKLMFSGSDVCMLDIGLK